MKLFTYGSLMFPEVWQRVTGLTAPGCSARLADYAARRLRGQTYPALVIENGAVTTGVLYEEVTAEVMSRLDDFEGSFYERVEVVLILPEGGETRAWLYRAAEGSHPDILNEPWDGKRFAVEDLGHFLREDAGFSEKGR